MWNRNTYGAVATRMIETYPWFGIGVGSFHVMFADFATARRAATMTVPDNAQNWYRHQLAEFGVIGSLAWIAWIGALLATLFRRGVSSSCAGMGGPRRHSGLRVDVTRRDAGPALHGRR